MVLKKNNILLTLIIKLNQKKGFKLKSYNIINNILLKINKIFNINKYYFLEKAIFNTLLSFSFEIIYINNTKFKIPVFISLFKSIKQSIKILSDKNKLYHNLINSFNLHDNVIKLKINKIKESYKNKIHLNNINVLKFKKLNKNTNKNNFKLNKIIDLYNNYYINN